MSPYYRGGLDRPLFVHHVAIRLSISRRTVRHWAKTGKIKAFKDRKTPKLWRFRKHDVDEFVEQHGFSRIGSISRNASWIGDRYQFEQLNAADDEHHPRGRNSSTPRSIGASGAVE